MRRAWTALPAALAAVLMMGGPLAAAADVTFARHLALSPDGRTLAFSWAGDIWTVPAEGGTATRLTVHPAHESHVVWSRDGAKLAFASDRHGAANVFLMDHDGRNVRRLTYATVAEYPTDFSADGRWVYFHAAREGEVSRVPRMYRVPTEGGQVWRAMECFGSDPRVSPDGERVAFVRGRTPWARRGYRGSANFEVFVGRPGSDEFVQVTAWDGTDRDPAWNAAGDGLYYLSDRGGTLNVWYQPMAGGDPEPVTKLSGDDVREFTVSRDGSTLAFTHWDRLYVMKTRDRLARAISVVAGEDAVRNDVVWRTFTANADEIEASPDGGEIALVVHGEIVVVKTEKDKPTRRVTDSAARDQHVTWSPDGKALIFASDREGQEDIYRAMSAEDKPLSDSLRFRIERVTDHPELEYAPQVSPDGEKLAFIRGRGSLIIRDLKTGEETALLESWNRPTFRWSPDSKWMAYAVEDVEHNPDVWVVPVDRSKPAVNISQHPDYDGNPQWSADGQIIAFSSARHGFDTDLYLVFLSRELDELPAVERTAYFEKQAEKVKKRKPLKEAAASGKIRLAGVEPEIEPAATQPAETQPAETQPAATQPAEEDELEARVRRLVQKILAEQEKKEPTRPKPAGESKEDEEKDEKNEKDKKGKEKDKVYAYDLETCWRRIRRVTGLPLDQSNFALAPDGQLLAFVSSHEGEARVFTIKWDGEDRKQILSSAAGALHWGLDGKKLYYLKGGVPNSCGPTGSGAEAHRFQTRLAISQRALADQKFSDAARQLGMRFYHPTMKGLDWSALAQRYKALAVQTQTIPEFNEVFNMLLGELNASHMGIYGPRTGGDNESVGYLGCTFDPTFEGPGLRVASILPDSPADHAHSKLEVGDILLTVNGVAVGPDCPIEYPLINMVGEEVILAFIPSPDREAPEPEEEPESKPAEADEPEPSGEAAAGAADDKADDASAQDQGDTAQEADADADVENAAEPATREMVMRPVAMRRISELQYEAWVRDNQAYVHEKAGGRVGYLHIEGMDEASFEVFERDLYAAAHGRDGLIIDVRNNGGGWTADWVMAVLNVRRHAYTVPRGGQPGYPQDRLIFYAWTKPTTMMCNEQSFSNAEIVSHAFKNLGRGPLVGMTTHGGVISTGGYGLLDGAFVRIPMRGWYTLPDGVDMELNGAEPDVKVPVTPADEVNRRRPQLDAAIQATLAQLEQGQATGGPAAP